MVKGREKSDGCIVPDGAGNSFGTAGERRGGKATTASNQAKQLYLFGETADSPRGDVVSADGGRPPSELNAVPKSPGAKSVHLPAMVMEEVAHDGNLKKAWENVAANDGAPGADRKTIEEVRLHVAEILPRLREELLAGTYQPGDIRRVWIPKPGGGQRGLGIPDVVDRVVQQAVYQVMLPHYDPEFHENSHGFRPGRSCQTAIGQAIGYLEEGYEWVVDIDIEKFFDRVNHDRLLWKLSQRIEDKRLLTLIRRMLKANVVMPDGVVVNTEEGTPQGGPLSPLLSNIVLDELDRELEARGHRFVRYADDCNIYVRSERSGKRVLESISRFLERRLRLKVNETKSSVSRPERRHFLGFRLRVDPQDEEVEVLLSERSVNRIKEKIRELTPRNWGKSLDECIRRINNYLQGWMGFFRIVTDEERRSLGVFDAHIRRRLRAIKLKQWKRKRTIAKNLIKLGVGVKSAWRQLYKAKRRLWDLSHCPAVDKGLRNAYFAECGLKSLKEMWDQAHKQAQTIVPRQLLLPRIAAGRKAVTGI